MMNEPGSEIRESRQSDRVRDALHAAGLRATPQRTLILSILEETGGHLDAQELHLRAKAQMPNLNLVTVYRTLDALRRSGLVRQQYFSRDHRREIFEAVSRGEHYHLTCLGCGSVIEFSTWRIRQAQQELAESLGITFTHACVCFEGYCQQCASKRRQAPDRGEGLSGKALPKNPSN